MSYADMKTFEGFLADACLRHRLGNPYAELMTDVQHGAEVYAQALRMVRVYKVSRSLEEIAQQYQYQDLWSSYAKSFMTGSVLPSLEEATKDGDEPAFTKALAEIDWQNRPATDFIRAIDLALKVGAHLAARRLATEGADLHFDNEELQKYARILAPPQVMRIKESRQVDVAANVEWLKANKDNYRGMWVAVKDGTLMASASSHAELIAEIGETKGSGILVTTLY